MKKFAIIMLIVVLFASIALVAKADTAVYPMNAVVIGYEMMPWGDIEVTIADYDGNEYGYFESNVNIHIGDMVIVTIFAGEAEEEAEIVNVEYIGTMTVEEIVEWLCH